MNLKSSLLRLVCYFGIIFLFLGCATVEEWLAEPEDNAYDPSTVRLIQGTIDEVRGMNLTRRGADLNLTIITDEKETFTVNTGPVWYLNRLNINFQEGEIITVIGSVVDADDGLILAQEIRREGSKLLFRDQSGQPRWVDQSVFTRGNPNAYPGNRAAIRPSLGSY